jgi:hypothetical protein
MSKCRSSLRFVKLLSMYSTWKCSSKRSAHNSKIDIYQQMHDVVDRCTPHTRFMLGQGDTDESTRYSRLQ